jgi:hypothetical protein
VLFVSSAANAASSWSWWGLLLEDFGGSNTVGCCRCVPNDDFCRVVVSWLDTDEEVVVCEAKSLRPPSGERCDEASSSAGEEVTVAVSSERFITSTEEDVLLLLFCRSLLLPDRPCTIRSFLLVLVLVVVVVVTVVLPVEAATEESAVMTVNGGGVAAVVRAVGVVVGLAQNSTSDLDNFLGRPDRVGENPVACDSEVAALCAMEEVVLISQVREKFLAANAEPSANATKPQTVGSEVGQL